MDHFCTLKKCTGEKPAALLTFLANHNNALGTYNVCEGEDARGLAYFLSDGFQKVCKGIQC